MNLIPSDISNALGSTDGKENWFTNFVDGIDPVGAQGPPVSPSEGSTGIPGPPSLLISAKGLVRGGLGLLVGFTAWP